MRLKHLDEIHKKPPESIGPDETLTAAVSKLALHGVSLLVVHKNPRAPLGVIGWQHMGKAQLRTPTPERVSQCFQKVSVVQEEDSLLDVLPMIEQEGAVLVQGVDRTVIALLSSADASAALHRITVPSLLLDEIEQRLRALIEARLPQVLRTNARDAAGPTFGDYLRTIENPEHWGQLDLKLERSQVVAHLDAVRRIRNRYVHFAAEGISPGEVAQLRLFLGFLRMLGSG